MTQIRVPPQDPDLSKARYTALLAYAVYVVVFLALILKYTDVYTGLLYDHLWLVGDVIATALIIYGTVHQHPVNMRAWSMFMLSVITYFIADTLLSIEVNYVVCTTAYLTSTLLTVSACILCLDVMHVTVRELIPNAVNALLPFALLVGWYMTTLVLDGQLEPMVAVLEFIIAWCDFLMFTGHVVMFTGSRAARLLTPRVGLINSAFVLFVVSDAFQTALYASGLYTDETMFAPGTMMYYVNDNPFWSLPCFMLALASTYNEPMPADLDKANEPVRFVTMARVIIPHAFVVAMVLVMYSNTCRCPLMTVGMVATCMVTVRLLFISLQGDDKQDKPSK